MSQYIPPKLYGALVNEISRWREEKLISEEAAQVLISRYPVSQGKSSMVTAMTIIGAVLVGLGVLLYVSANWHNIATIWKLSILVGSVVLSHIAGWQFKYEPGGRPRLGTAFFLLGSFLYGGSIWLVSQMFNLDLSIQDGTFLWAMGAIASALVNRSVPLAILSSILMGVWGMCPSDSVFSGLGSDSWNPDLGFHFAAATTGSIVLAVLLRSRAVAWISLLTGALWAGTVSGAGCPGLLCYGIALFGGYLWARTSFKLLEAPFKYVGLSAALLSMLILTVCRGADYAHVYSAANFAGLLVMAIASLAVVLFTDPDRRIEALSAAGIMILCLATKAIPDETIRLISVNSLLIAAMVSLIMTGSHRLKSAGLINAALVFLVLDIIFRYFDFFFSMMNKSAFFILGGVILMTAGAVAEKSRRQLLEGLHS